MLIDTEKKHEVLLFEGKGGDSPAIGVASSSSPCSIPKKWPSRANAKIHTLLSRKLFHRYQRDFTTVQVTNETTLGASRRSTECGRQPLALNFANGVVPGGGFLQGATAQEEALCRSSALYATLVNDPMYEVHRSRDEPDSTDWVIYSPNVPIFREDDGSVLEKPWLLSFITCAAPYAPEIGQPRSGDLLQQRIHRILSVCRAYGASSLVLGAWGCGAFKNDPKRTARDFRRSLETDFAGVFAEIVFAVTDWSPERRFLTPFHEAFSE